MSMPFMCSAQNGFTDVALGSGVDFVAIISDPLGLPAQGGAAWFDFDGDLDEDLYLTGGMLPDALFRNDGTGSFINVTQSAGFEILDTSVYTMGVVTGDIDNDGFREVFITTEDHNLNYLFYNNGDGTFTDISVSAGVAQGGNSASAAFGDYNLDGFLDLYVTNWCVEFTEGQVDTFPTIQNYFYVNNGNLTFTEVSEALEIDNSDGCSLAVTFTDYDDDGDMDIFLANDFGFMEGNSSNRLYKNLYPLNGFEDVSVETNMDVGIFGMGVAIGDYDENGRLDYYVTNGGPDRLFRNDGNDFSDQLVAAGIEYLLSPCLNPNIFRENYGWSCGFLDFNNDSYLDLFVANGDIGVHYPRPCLNECKLFQNNAANGTFTDVSQQMGVADDYMSRGAAIADYDLDGDLDILLCMSDTTVGNHKVRLFNNELTGMNWIVIRPEGVTGNRDAFGSRVEVMFQGRHLIREVDGGSGFNSHHSSQVHFGLGTTTLIDTLRVTWMGGGMDEYYDVPVNQYLNLIEQSNLVSISQSSPEEFSNDNFIVSPNPISEANFSVSLNLIENKTIDLKLVGTRGRVLYSFLKSKTVERNETLKLSLPRNIKAGMYQLQLSGDNVWVVQKLLVIR